MVKQTGICNEPGCNKPLGIEEWEYEGLCWEHTDQLFRFIYLTQLRADGYDMIPSQLDAFRYIDIIRNDPPVQQ